MAHRFACQSTYRQAAFPLDISFFSAGLAACCLTVFSRHLPNFDFLNYLQIQVVDELTPRLHNATHLLICDVCIDCSDWGSLSPTLDSFRLNVTQDLYSSVTGST